MSKLTVVVLLAICAAGGAHHYGFLAFGGDVKVVGEAVHADIDGFSATYSINGPASETYMMLGGRRGGSSFAHASFIGAEVNAIRPVRKRYPDFNRCDSPAAPEVRRIAESIQVVADPRLLSQFSRVMADAASRDQLAGGERLCAAVKGQWLTLEKVERGDTVVTGEEYMKMIPSRSLKQYFLHLQSFETRDCRDSV